MSMILRAVAVEIHSRACIVASIQYAWRPTEGLLIYSTQTTTTVVAVVVVNAVLYL